MASDYRRSCGSPSTHNRYIGQELGRMQHQYLEGDQHVLSSNPHHPQPHLFSLAQSYGLHGALYREIEKERIRQEVIMSEILRRRALEAEVRRELMLERELARQRGSSGLHCGSPSATGLDLPMRLPLEEAEGKFLEERMMLSLKHMNNLSNRHESRLSESVQVQCASDNVRSVRSSVVKPLLEEIKEKKKINLQVQCASDNVRSVRSSEVKPLLEEVKEKKKINLQAQAMGNITGAAKTIENITGAKRDSSGLDAGESEYSNLKKRVKKEWSCDLCQVSASSERALNEHLQGKKHKAKEAAPSGPNASKTYRIGLDKKKVAKSISGSETVDPVMNVESKVTSEPLAFSKSGDDDLENLNSDSLMKNELEVVKKDDTKHRFWCEICKIGAPSQKVMDSHQMGKKHRRQVGKKD